MQSQKSCEICRSQDHCAEQHRHIPCRSWPVPGDISGQGIGPLKPGQRVNLERVAVGRGGVAHQVSLLSKTLSSRAAYSTLIFAALMIGHHFSISALGSAPSTSGVC